MNYLEAVKELVENPKAICICFPGKSGQTLKLTRSIHGQLIFFQREGLHNFRGGLYPEFILRTDFWVEYKAEETRQQAHKRGYCEGYEDGIKAARETDRQAFKQFKQDMKKLFGEDF